MSCNSRNLAQPLSLASPLTQTTAPGADDDAATKRLHICSECSWVVPCSSAVHDLVKASIRRDARDYAQMRVLDGNAGSVLPPYTFEAVSEILATKLKFDKGAWYYDDYLQKWLPFSEDSKRLKPSVDAILPVFPIESSAGVAPGRHVAGNVALTSITLNIAKNVYGPDVILFYLQAVSIMQEDAGLLDDLANLTSAADLVPLGPRIRQRAQAQSRFLGVVASPPAAAVVATHPTVVATPPAVAASMTGPSTVKTAVTAPIPTIAPASPSPLIPRPRSASPKRRPIRPELSRQSSARIASGSSSRLSPSAWQVVPPRLVVMRRSESTTSLGVESLRQGRSRRREAPSAVVTRRRRLASTAGARRDRP